MFEKENIATFKITNKEIYELAKEKINNHREELQRMHTLEGKLYEDKLYGFIKECGEEIYKNIGVRIM